MRKVFLQEMKNEAPEIEGCCFNLPVVGRAFTMFGDCAEDDMYGVSKIVSTTEVKSVTFDEDRNTVFFKTDKMHYQLEYEDE